MQSNARARQEVQQCHRHPQVQALEVSSALRGVSGVHLAVVHVHLDQREVVSQSKVTLTTSCIQHDRNAAYPEVAFADSRLPRLNRLLGSLVTRGWRCNNATTRRGMTMPKRLVVGVLAGCVSLLVAFCLSSSPAVGSGDGVVVSRALPDFPSNPLVDNVHRRVFESFTSRLISLRFDLSRSRSVRLARGTHHIFLGGDDSALFDLTVPGLDAATGRLTRRDPLTLARTGSWSEPDVYAASNIVFSQGLFWALVERTPIDAEYSRVVLATLDPRHPGKGWYRRMSARTTCGGPWAGGCYLVAAPRGHWLAAVLGGSTGTVDLYKVWADGTARWVSETTVPNFQNGPNFSPDGSAAIMDAFYSYSSSGGFTAVHLPDLAEGEFRSGNSISTAGYTSDGRWIAALDEWGDSEFYDPTDLGAPPEVGARIPLTSRVSSVLVQSAWRPAYPSGRPFFFALIQEDLDTSTGSQWKYFVARYPTP